MEEMKVTVVNDKMKVNATSTSSLHQGNKLTSKSKHSNIKQKSLKFNSTPIDYSLAQMNGNHLQPSVAQQNGN